MKRLIFIAVFFSTLIYSTSQVSASVPADNLFKSPAEQKVFELLLPKEEPKPAEEIKPVVYLVQPGDNLTKIASQHQTTVARLFDKNTGVADPNNLVVGQAIVVPLPEEVLPARPLPAVPAPVAAQPQPTRSSLPAPSRRAIPGNTYSYGYCTWYVKNRRANLPNNLGNADTWYARAKAQGIPTGTAPRAGAAGMTKAYMHVVYIEEVRGSQVYVSEMNYTGWNRKSYRLAPASEFLYIY